MATFVPTQHLQTYKALSPTRPELSAKGKSVLVTGGGYGIGRSIAESFAAAGASRVGISGRTEARLQSAIAELKQAYPKTGFSYFAADITDEPVVKAMFQAFGAPDLSKPGPIKTADLKEWWQGFEINVLGTAIVTQQFLHAKAKGKEAVVITVNTIGAHLGTMVPNLSGYGGSKAASLRMIECFQAENPEVRFVSVHPGAVATDVATKSELTGMEFTDAELSADFILWTASPEADFLKGRFAWVNWDIAELKAKKSEILEKNLLKYTLGGF